MSNETTDMVSATPELDPRMNGVLVEDLWRVMHDQEVGLLPEEQQGSVLTDYFIGELVGVGEAAIDRVPASPGHILDELNRGVELDTWDQTMGALTRENGLRWAAFILGGDTRTGGKIKDMPMRFVRYGDGSAMALASYEQVAGYLDGVTAGEAQPPSWKSVLMDMVQQHQAESPGHIDSWRGYSSDLLTSQVPLVHDNQLKVARALKEASESGVDLQLLLNSAEKISSLEDAGGYAGSVDVARAIQRPPDYSQLLTP
jgi:hypothetical protein